MEMNDKTLYYLCNVHGDVSTLMNDTGKIVA